MHEKLGGTYEHATYRKKCGFYIEAEVDANLGSDI